MAGTLGLVAAVACEVGPLLERLQARERREEGGLRLAEGRLGARRVLLVRGGIGAERAAAAARRLVGEGDLDELLSIGFAAALRPELLPGALVLGEGVCRPQGAWDPDTPLDPSRLVRRNSSAELLARARAVAARLKLGATGGGLLLVPRVLVCRAEKQAAAESGLVAAEMEGYAVAEAATEKNRPFLAVRVISDRFDQELTGLDGLVGPDGEVAAGRAAGRFLLRPWALPRALRLFAQSRRAAEKLAAFLEAYAGEGAGG